MKILVTGGAGFIGSHLVDRLVVDQAGPVTVLDNFSRGKAEHLALSMHQVNIVHGDIRNRALLQEAMSGVEIVYHLAAQSNVLGAVRDVDYCFETNVVGTYEVLRAAAAAGVRRVVFTSSREVYGEPATLPVTEDAPISPKNPYGVSKAAGEMYCRLIAASGMEIVILRLANVYGTRDSDRVIPLFAEQSLAGEALTVFGNHKILDFLWIEDLIDVFCRASRCPCPQTPVNVGSGKGVNLKDLAARILQCTAAGSSVHITAERQPEVGRFVADVTLARKLFGLHCPQDPLEHVASVVEFVQRRLRPPSVDAGHAKSRNQLQSPLLP